LNPAARVAAILCLQGAVGCGSSPPSTFYALSAESGATKPGPVHTLKLRRPAIAGYLDRQVIVQHVVDHRLGLVDTDRWAAPLDEMLERVLAQDVEQRLTGSVVFTEDGSILADADIAVEVDVRRLDIGDAGQVTLEAEVAIVRGDAHAPLAARTIQLRQVPRGTTTTALVSAMSDLVGRLADAIAALVRSSVASVVPPVAPPH